MSSSIINPSIGIAFECDDLKSKAHMLSDELNYPLASLDASYDFFLLFTMDGLALHASDKQYGNDLRIDFLAGKTEHRRRFGGGRGQLLARACAVKGKELPSIIDATAGLGQDAFVLASLGCDVTLLERSPIIAALLQDALERLAQAEKMPLNLVKTDANDYFSKTKGVIADVIYLDPMFPPRQKQAKVKKEMQILQALLGHAEEDEMKLLSKALRAAKKRVVVKRPKGAPYYANQTPAVQYTGKSSRFDVYLPTP